MSVTIFAIQSCLQDYNDHSIQKENLLTLQREWVKMTTNMHSKLSRMNKHKDDLSQKYWQMKKEAKAVRGTGNKRLGIMVNASQDSISVGTRNY